MGLQAICERCGAPSRVWHYDMYGKACRTCKKNDVPPSDRQRESFEQAVDRSKKASGLMTMVYRESKDGE